MRGFLGSSAASASSAAEDGLSEGGLQCRPDVVALGGEVIHQASRCQDCQNQTDQMAQEGVRLRGRSFPSLYDIARAAEAPLAFSGRLRLSAKRFLCDGARRTLLQEMKDMLGGARCAVALAGGAQIPGRHLDLGCACDDASCSRWPWSLVIDDDEPFRVEPRSTCSTKASMAANTCRASSIRPVWLTRSGI